MDPEKQPSKSSPSASDNSDGPENNGHQSDDSPLPDFASRGMPSLHNPTENNNETKVEETVDDTSYTIINTSPEDLPNCSPNHQFPEDGKVEDKANGGGCSQHGTTNDAAVRVTPISHPLENSHLENDSMQGSESKRPEENIDSPKKSENSAMVRKDFLNIKQQMEMTAYVRAK